MWQEWSPSDCKIGSHSLLFVVPLMIPTTHQVMLELIFAPESYQFLCSDVCDFLSLMSLFLLSLMLTGFLIVFHEDVEEFFPFERKLEKVATGTGSTEGPLLTLLIALGIFRAFGDCCFHCPYGMKEREKITAVDAASVCCIIWRVKDETFRLLFYWVASQDRE